MTLLSRYITCVWLRLLAICMGSFVSVYLILDMMDKIPRFVRAGGKSADIVHFFLYKLPEIVGQTAAFSILMATLLTLGLLSRNSEITAMRSCGVSLARIAFPMVLMGGVASCLLLLNAEFVVPVSYEQMEYVERVKIRKQGINAVFKKNNIWFRSDNLILQARLFDPAHQTLIGVTLWTVDKGMNPVSRLDADRAEFKNGGWTLFQLDHKEFLPGGGFRSSRLNNMAVNLRLRVDDLKVLDNNADNFSYVKLREYADNLRKGGYPAFRYLTLMYSKLATPFSALVMVVLGIPFAMRNSRSGGIAIGIGASVMIGFAYFVVNAILLSYGRSGVLPAVAAAWGANVLFCLGGVWLSMTVRR